MNFNGNDLRNRIVIKKKTRDILPDLSVVTISPPKKVGSHYVRNKIGQRVIEVEYTIIEDSRGDLREEVLSIAKILNQSEPKKMFFYDEANIFYNAKLVGSTPTDEVIATAKGKLTFVCPDPYKYAKYGTILQAEDLIDLNYSTPCEIEVTLNGSASYFEVSVGDDTIRFEQNFIAGDVVTIDTKLRTAYLNGSTDIRKKKTITSEWIEIQSGEVSVDPASADLEIVFIERWL